MIFSRNSRFLASTTATVIASVLIASLATAVPEEGTPKSTNGAKAYEPKIAAKSGDAKAAIGAMTKPEGFTINLWAAEPDVANPVAFCIDEKGRIYVAETFRQGDEGGVVDNRNHMYWLDDDLAAMTVEDRRKFMLKHRKDKLEQWTKHHDRIRLLEDTNGDNVADKATVFSTGYNDLVDGTGAGVLAWRGTVYYTNIPKVYALRDKNSDGVADESKVLSDGYGVRVAFRGHDLHGLVMGPDGRIYFSIGDRGYHIVTKEGKTLSDPESGAVFRCEPDGSHLEVVHTGLRNPQELVFDDYGNLFTGDNNSDGGDAARWVYIAEGGHTGWNMAFQYLPDRGPWNREGWWHLWDPKKPQAAHVLPPLKHIGNGPSGVAYYPGTGLPENFRGTFFMCDFKGGANASGVWQFKLKPRGAWFEVEQLERFVWNTLVTDVDFGPDGAVYFSDWVHGWTGEGKGRIYRMTHGEEAKAPIVAQTKQFLAEGFKQRTEQDLMGLLEHPDRRVRQEAQFALVEKNSYDFLVDSVKPGRNQLSRLHGIWGLAQAARISKDASQLPNMIASFSQDQDAEVRAQVAKVLLEFPSVERGRKQLAKLATDADARVRSFALPSFGKSMAKGDANDHQAALSTIFNQLADAADKDPYLRHAAVMGLTYLNNADALVAKMKDENRSVRLGILLALRRMKDQRVVGFLHDTDAAIVTEAARAIHDQPIEEAMPQLAAMLGFKNVPKDDALLRRAISANYRLGGKRQADVLAAFAKRDDVPASARAEALDTLIAWEGKSPRDRVLGSYRPVLPRPADEAAPAASAVALELLKSNSDASVRQAAAKVVEQFRVADASPVLLEITKNSKESGWLRIAALKALGALNDASLSDAVTSALSTGDPNLRKEARAWLAKLKPAEAIATIESVLETGETGEKQGAIATLAAMKQPGADAVLEKQLDKLIGNKLAPELALDLLEAAAARATPRMKLMLAAFEASMPKDDPLQHKRHLLHGGDVALGKKIFWEKTAASCNRCHKVGSDGLGEAGPNLGEIGKQPREHILESVLFPNKKIAQGFDTYDIETMEGDRIIGVLREETADALIIVTPENKRITVKKSDVAEKRKALSAMPDNVAKLLTEREIRDLVGYLAGLK